MSWIAYELNHECASSHNNDKTQVQMFYFDSNMTIPLQCVALVFGESLC